MGEWHVSNGFGCLSRTGKKVVNCLFYAILIIPGGVVWTEDELRTVAEICYEEKVLVFSDEIHADLTLPPYKHRPFCYYQ